MKDNTLKLKQLINEFKARESKEKQSNLYSKSITERIIQIFEKNEAELDRRNEKGVIDFKLLILDGYNHLLITSKDRLEIGKKFFKLINKYLKTENEEIGLKIYKYLINIANAPYEKISELNIRAYIEILIFINDNSQRIIEIWNNNINNIKDKIKEKILAKDSFELLSDFIYWLNCFLKIYNNYINSSDQKSTDYLNQLKENNEKIIGNIKKIIDSIAIIKKEDISSNSKSFLSEKYYFLLSHSLFLFYLLKNKNINEKEEEITFFSFKFIIKNSLNNMITQMAMKYFEDILKSTKSVFMNNQKNYYYQQIIKDWKIYFNENTYLHPNYKLESKYNIIIKFIIRFYSYCFDIQENNQKMQIFKDISKLFIEDKLAMFKNFIMKLNDFRVCFEYKIQIIQLIKSFYDWAPKKYFFDNFYFFLKQITSFYQCLFSITHEYVGVNIREEKMIEKEILQKNMIKINDEENEDLNRKQNLNHLFLILLKNEYENYTYRDDQKQLSEFLKISLIALEKLIEIFKIILNDKDNSIEKKSFMINKTSAQFSKFFFFYFSIFEKNKVNHQNHENQNEGLDKLIEIYLTSFSYDFNLFTAVFQNLMPFIYKLYKLGCKICPKNCILTKIIHNIFKGIKNIKIRENLFFIYFEYFSSKIYEAGNPIENFNKNQKNFNNNLIILNDTINNITILKSIFFNLLDCISDFDYFKNNVIPLIIDTLYLSKNSEYYGNYIYILRCCFKYLKTAINVAQNQSENQTQEEIEEKRLKLKFFYKFNNEIVYLSNAIIKYLINIKEKTAFLRDWISEIIMNIPFKFTYLLDNPHLVFPSLVDSLNRNTENIYMELNLENWMNCYIKFPENIVPFI